MIAEQLITLVQQYEVWAVMLGMVIEEVVVPIPSPVIPMAAGALIIDSTTLLPAMVEIALKVAIPASVASVLSSYFVYGLAYKGGKPFIQRYGKYLDIKWEEVEKLERHFDSGKEGYYVALFRAIPVVPLSLVSGSAGLFRMNWKSYGLWSFAGMLPRNFTLALIGWTAKESFMDIASRIDKVSTGVAILVLGTLVAIVAYRKISKLYKKLIF